MSLKLIGPPKQVLFPKGFWKEPEWLGYWKSWKRTKRILKCGNFPRKINPTPKRRFKPWL